MIISKVEFKKEELILEKDLDKPIKEKEIKEQNLDKPIRAELTEARKITQLALEQPISQESDITGVIKVMNEDSIETDTGFASIDMKARILTPYEKSSITIHDTVVHLNCLPTICLVTTRKSLRLSVSLRGEGRNEVVRIVQGEREKQASGGFIDKFKGMFTPSQ